MDENITKEDLRQFGLLIKISSVHNYHKCLHELDEYGYLWYEPSFKKTRGTQIYFFDFEISKTQLL